MVDIRQDKGVFPKLLDVVKHVSDEVDRYFVNRVNPLLDNLKYVLARVSTTNVRNYVLSVAVVYSQHLNDLLLIFNLFLELVLDVPH
jgi:hypothetical protein